MLAGLSAQSRRFTSAAVAMALAPVLLLGLCRPASAEDGYELWLRYQQVESRWVQPYRDSLTHIISEGDSPTLDAAQAELVRGLSGLLGVEVPVEVPDTGRAGALILGTPRSSSRVAGFALNMQDAGDEGFVIRTVNDGGRPAIVIAANEDLGVLYGAFHFLRLLQTRQPLDRLDILEAPRVRHRMLNHWDNLDRHVERGYAGASIWDWHRLPDWLDPRYTDYARANASLGINAASLTNVNANAISLTPAYLGKAAALADVFRPYGIRVFLTARFNAPMEIGGLDTADPLDDAVRRWWADKAAEIFEAIPDFGGFLVKANSEGQPGPQDYGRSHADGANLLADAIAPHGGLVIWRAFVYSDEEPDDRAKQAYTEFVPLDGEFRDNVMVQVKNGPIDFQPREPFHPLFGAMPETPLMMEFQITKEYLGFATHMAWLAPLFQETLQADIRGDGTKVAGVIDGSLHGYAQTGMAGVANIGTDRNWSGSHFDQANWYAFGRLAWNHGLPAQDIGEEWLRMTFSNEDAFLEPVLGMMMRSRETVVDYMTPLGLHHLMGRGHHYGPGPWVDGGPRADWTSVYYHRATEEGIGFDRTSNGSDAVSQYAPEIAARFADLERVPEELLLWFHHVSWDYRMRSGRTLWHELVHRYTRGVAAVGDMRDTWQSVAEYVDPERHRQTATFLAIQEKEAKWWRDASIAYFQAFSGRPVPAGFDPPRHPLEHYKSLEFPYAPGN